MSPPNVLFAMAALIPAMTAPAEGTPRSPIAGAIAVALCGGDSVTLPLGNGTPPATPPCCAKGCRTGDRRKRA